MLVVLVTAFKNKFVESGVKNSNVNLNSLDRSLQTENNCKYEKAFEECVTVATIKHKAGICPACGETHSEDYEEIVPGIGMKIICDDVPTGPVCGGTTDCN